MNERNRQHYCTRCGNAVGPTDNFCRVCGASAAPAAADDQHTSFGGGSRPLITVGIVVMMLLVLGVGSVAATTLLRGEMEPAANTSEIATAEDGRKAESKERPEKATTPKPDQGESGRPDQDATQGSKEEPAPSEASGPSPGYNLIETPDGSLSAEVPQSWGVETGEDSEKEAGPNTWSYVAGEYLYSSITTAPNLDAWYSTGTSGTYFVASEALAQYSDYELTNSLLNAGKNETCSEVGPYEDYDRESYSGKIQA
jgi:hypothetical protein